MTQHTFAIERSRSIRSDKTRRGDYSRIMSTRNLGIFHRIQEHVSWNPSALRACAMFGQHALLERAAKNCAIHVSSQSSRSHPRKHSSSTWGLALILGDAKWTDGGNHEMSGRPSISLSATGNCSPLHAKSTLFLPNRAVVGVT